MPPNDTQTPTFEVHLPPPPLSKAEREKQAFLRLLPQLLRTHRGQFVAIHDEQVVDTDRDDIALIQRVQEKVGYVPIHVGLVTEQQPVFRIPHCREHHGASLPTKLERERSAFLRLLPNLLSTHRGQYVAVHDEQVVDSGGSRLDVASRVWQRIGYVDIYVGLVSDDPEPISRSGVRRELGQRGASA